MDLITLKTGDWIAEVAPSIGGAMLSLAHKGEPILRPTSPEAGDARFSAGYPMIPYANRIDHGRFSFAGRDYQLNPTAIALPHSLHGVGWRRVWTVETASTQSCTLGLVHHPDADWPFAFRAAQQFVLSNRRLILRMSVTNLDKAPAPAGLGWHPFFRRRPGETLTFGANAAWRNGPDLLPSAIETGPDWNYGGGQALDQRGVDNDFSDWGGLARLAAPAARSVLLRASRTFGVLRLYTPVGQDFYGVEPVSHLANAINRPELVDNAMTILAPGASLRGDIEIEIEEARR